MEILSIGWIDSLVMAAAMGMAGCPHVYRRQAVFGFMAFDFTASLTGWTLTVPRATIVLLAFALSFAVIAAARKWPALYGLVPVLCSVDNLFMGSGGGPFRFLPALGEGVASGIVAWAGFKLGGLLLKHVKGVTA
jgi:hypothetical protein